MTTQFRFWKGEKITSMSGANIFVFGSNPEGRHGAGAAKAAMAFNAQYGNGRGLQGNTYALVTKNLKKGYYENASGITYDKAGERSVSKEQISANIDELYECARNNPHLKFFITYQYDPKKTNLNGYSHEEMFDLFTEGKDVPDNIRFHESYKLLMKQRLSQDNFTFFWKASSPFSQWHPSAFKYKDVQFISCEQFMMYSKAKLFNDHKVADKILNYNNSVLGRNFISGKINAADILNDPYNYKVWSKIQKNIKDLGKMVTGFEQKIWDEKNVPIITVGNREKYSQNEHLYKELLNTKNSRLVEASPYDKVYGIGMESTHPDALDPKKWKGKNLLGDVLTSLKFYFQKKIENKNKIRNRPQ